MTRKKEPSAGAKAAARCRRALKEKHPGTKFRVRIHTSSGYRYSLKITWTDGPTRPQVLTSLAGLSATGSILTERRASLRVLAELLVSMSNSTGSWIPNGGQVAERFKSTDVPLDMPGPTRRGELLAEMTGTWVPVSMLEHYTVDQVAGKVWQEASAVRRDGDDVLEVYLGLRRDRPGSPGTHKRDLEAARSIAGNP